MRVLLIEDDVDLAATVAEYLAARGWQVDHAYDGLAGLRLVEAGKPDLVILDIGLPGLDGLQVCERLRRDLQASMPVLMLTARDALEDKLEGFDRGADDYLVKPFSLAELERRLQALLRRSQGRTESIQRVGPLELNLHTREVRRGGTLLSLSRLEFEVLALLMTASPAAVSKEELARRVWNEDFVGDETIRAHIYQLRQVVDKPFDQPLIQTIRGYGHALREAAKDA